MMLIVSNLKCGSLKNRECHAVDFKDKKQCNVPNDICPGFAGVSIRVGMYLSIDQVLLDDS